MNKFKFRPRFFILCGVLILAGGIFASNLLLKKRVEVKIVDSNSGNGRVLAATSDQAVQDLIGGDIGGEVGGPIGSPKDAVQKTNVGGSDITSYEPVTISYTVKEGDTLASISEKYHADAQTIADFPNNGLRNSLQLKVGQILIIPNGYIDESQKPPPPPIAQGTGQFSWPFDVSLGKPVITQYAYYWHPGALDIALPLGSGIRASDDGTVKVVEYSTTGYGIHVIIDHGNGLTSLYGHLSEVRVTQGQGVRKGDVIGLSGSTGRSTGPHLHFEVRSSGAPVDPMTLLPAE